jgi:hypothetical protein
MTVATMNISERVGTEGEVEQGSIRGLVKASGLMYLMLLVLGMFSPLVLESLVVPGSASGTAENLLNSKGLFGFSLITWFAIVAVDVAISVTLYQVLAKSGRTVALIMAGFRIVYAAVLGSFLLDLYGVYGLLNASESLVGADLAQNYSAVLAGVEKFQNGFQLALMFFGVNMVLLGVSVLRSGYFPKVIGIVLSIAGFGYLIDSLTIFLTSNHNDSLSIALLTPALIGEVALTVWLLAKGRKVSALEAIAAE